MTEESTEKAAAKPSDGLSPEANRAANIKVWAIFIVIAVVLIACLVKGGGSSGGDGGALVACKDYVKDRLKSPGTADFSELTMSRSDAQVTVSGAVDSQNSFGGVVRNNFTCVVSGSGDSWRLVSLSGLTR